MPRCVQQGADTASRRVALTLHSLRCTPCSVRTSTQRPIGDIVEQFQVFPSMANSFDLNAAEAMILALEIGDRTAGLMRMENGKIPRYSLADAASEMPLAD